MASVQNEHIIGLTAGEDLSAKQYYLGKVSTAADNTVLLAGLGNDAMVILNEPASGEAASLCDAGITKVAAGAAFTRGDKLMSDATGRAITAVGAAARHVVLVALESASGAGAVARVLVSRQGILA